MKSHDIKSHAGIAFDAVWARRKLHEVRANDRNYAEGDRVIMREWRPGEGYSGRWVQAEIMHVTYGPNWGIPDGLCVFSFDFTARSASPESDTATERRRLEQPFAQQEMA